MPHDRISGEDDVFDVTSKELQSREHSTIDRYRTAVTVTSTTASTKTVQFSGLEDWEHFIQGADNPIEPGDKLIISGTDLGDGDGTYTIAIVPTKDSVTVVEDIEDDTGGAGDFIHRMGAKRAGYYNPAIPGNNVYEAISTSSQASPSSTGFLFVNGSPSDVLKPLGEAANSYKPRRRKFLSGIAFMFEKAGAVEEDYRARVFRWDPALNEGAGGAELIYRLIITAKIVGMYEADEYIPYTPGAVVIDPALNHRMFYRIDVKDNPGDPDDEDYTTGSSPGNQIAQITLVVEEDFIA